MKPWLATPPPPQRSLAVQPAQHLKEMASMPCLRMMHHVHDHHFGLWTQRLLVHL